MRGLKIRLKGFWCDTIPGVKAVSSMGRPGSSESTKDHSTRATAIYIDLKMWWVKTKHSIGHTVRSPVGNVQPRACTKNTFSEIQCSKNRYVPSSKTESEQPHVFFDLAVCTNPALRVEDFGVVVDSWVSGDAPWERSQDYNTRKSVRTDQWFPKTVAPAGMHMPFCGDD